MIRGHQFRDDSILKIRLMVFYSVLAFCVAALVLWGTRDHASVLTLFIALALIAVFPLLLMQQLSYRARFGSVSFVADYLPLKLGQDVSGEIVLSKALPEPELYPFRVRLSCASISGGGKQGGRVAVLWQTEWTCDEKSIAQSGEGVTVPVRFALPADSKQTHNGLWENIMWSLKVEAGPASRQHLRAVIPLPVTN
jgi:hypothetical protein